VAQAAIDSHRFVMECMEAAGCVVAHYTGFVLGPYDSAERRFVRDNCVDLLNSWPADVYFSDHVAARLPRRGLNPGRALFAAELDALEVGLAARKWPQLEREALVEAANALADILSDIRETDLLWPRLFAKDEQSFESWLVDNLNQLERVGWGLELVRRQYRVSDGAGRIDLLCRATTTGPSGAWPGDLVVIENKATSCSVDDLDQLDRYCESVQALPIAEGHHVFGLVIADGPGDGATEAVAFRDGIRLVTWVETGYWDHLWRSDAVFDLAEAWCGPGDRRPPTYIRATPFDVIELRSASTAAAVTHYHLGPPTDMERGLEVGCDDDGFLVTVAGDEWARQSVMDAIAVYGSPISIVELLRWFKPINGWTVSSPEHVPAFVKGAR